MSQFAAGQGRSLEALAGLAQRSGEGQAFNQRFAQERQLTTELQRTRQIGNQAAAAQQDREIRLQQLAFEQESNRIEGAQKAARAQADAERQAQAQTRQDRQSDIANAFKDRELDRMEQELGVRQQGEQRLQEKQAATGQPPLPGSPEANKSRRLLVAELADVSAALGDVNSDMNDKTRLSFETRRDQINNQLIDLDTAVKAAAVNASRTAQMRQTTRAVTQKEAGPVLEQTLEAAGQSRVLEVPTNIETGRPDTTKLKVGKIYQTPRGPAVRLAGNKWELIDELGDVDTTVAAQPTQPGARTQGNDFLSQQGFQNRTSPPRTF